MRRKDREITDAQRIQEVIASCQCCRLAFNDSPAPYIVPLNFGFAFDSGTLTLYFHGAFEGRKTELIRKNGFAGFEMDCGYELITADDACRHSARYTSVIGSGTVEILSDPAERRRGLSLLMEHATGRAYRSIPDAAPERVCVFKLTVREMACKEHL